MKITTIKTGLLVSILFCSILFSYRWKKAATIPDALAGNWSFTAFYPKKSDTLIFKTAASLSISPDRMVVGFTGCNRFRTECTLKGDSLSFGTILSTRKLCQTGYMDVEDRIKEILQHTTVYKLSGSTLLLYQGKKKLASLQKN